MPQSEVVILANSVKHRQHCVAGKCVNTRRWIRPVSTVQGAELSHQQAKIQNPHGTFNVKPLQKALMGFAQPAPLPHQPENYLIDGEVWIQHYSFYIRQLHTLLDTPLNLWGAGDRVNHALITTGLYQIPQSLYLVQVEDLRLYHNADGKRRASFTYGGINYDLAATDPRFDDIVRDNLPASGILCVSLGEPFQGHCYKLVATIF
ncbi:hypothetical protein N5M46_003880 [Vibrio alginolyticus]|nr:hypothetical protein [Vibrio alginolyticus]